MNFALIVTSLAGGGAERASMNQSLEVRVPLLGNLVLDLVLHWPAGVHYDADGGKALLRALARPASAGSRLEPAQTRLFGALGALLQRTVEHRLRALNRQLR